MEVRASVLNVEMLERLHTSPTSATSYQDKMTFVPIAGNLARLNPQKMEQRTPQACEEENLPEDVEVRKANLTRLVTGIVSFSDQISRFNLSAG